MRTTVGVFRSRSDAELGVQQLRSAGIPADQINVLTPGPGQEGAATRVPEVEGEQPGMVEAIGAVAGGAAGLGVGEGLATLLVPGVGPVLALGLVGGALLGALAGGAVGRMGENAIFPGLPEDEFFVYRDALRQGRTVIVAMVPDEKAEAARIALESAGAESVDRAREMWWIGLRDVEKEHYEAEGGNFDRDEADFKLGFEAAQQIETRELNARRPDTWNNAAFSKGYERGRKYAEGARQQRSESPTPSPAAQLASNKSKSAGR
jgi:hypothetical protein